MGLFDKVLGGGNDKLTEPEAMAGVALCAIASDGMITEEEINGLATSLSRMQMFDGNPKNVQRALDKAVKVLRNTKSAEQLLTVAAEAVTPKLKATAFAIAADLLMADGHVAPEEKAFLERIQKSLNVDDALAVKIVEVIAIKNQG